MGAPPHDADPSWVSRRTARVPCWLCSAGRRGLGESVPAARLRKLRMAPSRRPPGGFAIAHVGNDGRGEFLRELIRQQQARWAQKGGSERLRGELVGQ